jgi:putative transposase
MAHTFTDLLVHAVFSTSERRPFLTDAIRTNLHAYIGGILRELGAKPIAIGGTADHVHLLMSIAKNLAVADCMRVVKTNSSRWIKNRWPQRRTFAWQQGYGAFTVSESNRATVIHYIQNQEHHHQRMSFRDEFLAHLKNHSIEFDEQYLWR